MNSISEDERMDSKMKNNGQYSADNYVKTNKKPLLVGLLCVLFVIVVSIMIILIYVEKNKSVESGNFATFYSKAEEYMSNGDYENAILYFDKAIKINPKDAMSYVNLASIYIDRNDYENVKSILFNAIENTENDGFSYLVESLLDIQTGNATKDEIFDTFLRLYINNTAPSEEKNLSVVREIFDMITNNSYIDYVRTYGNSTVEIVERGVLSKVTFEGLNMIQYYESNDSNHLKIDSVNGKPADGGKPSKICAQSPDLIIVGEFTSISLDKLKKLFAADITVTEGLETEYACTFEYCGCTVYIESDEKGNVITSNPSIIIIPPVSDIEAEENSGPVGSVSGFILDATTGAGMQEVLLSFREGYDNKDGEVVYTTNTESYGAYKAEISEGPYTVEAKMEGFITEYYNVTVHTNTNISGQNIAMSRNLTDGTMRIVLEWGSIPNDLDLHMVGDNNTHVFFSNKTESVDGSMTASLDVDDISAYGPETITLSGYTSANYEFYVYNYSRGYDTQLSESGATVKVYMPGQTVPTEFSVPEGIGYQWNVFNIVNGVIVPVNQITEGQYATK